MQVDGAVSHTRPLATCLDASLVRALADHDIHTLFPVQAAVIPSIVGAYTSPLHPGDYCVCAPTGSGKTLAYVLPIIQCLHTRRIPHLRAVVILPTRELALQVKAVFESYIAALPSHATSKLHVGDVHPQIYVDDEAHTTYVRLASRAEAARLSRSSVH